jgi:hypothetical protein
MHGWSQWDVYTKNQKNQKKTRSLEIPPSKWKTMIWSETHDKLANFVQAIQNEKRDPQDKKRICRLTSEHNLAKQPPCTQKKPHGLHRKQQTKETNHPIGNVGARVEITTQKKHNNREFHGSRHHQPCLESKASALGTRLVNSHGTGEYGCEAE